MGLREREIEGTVLLPPREEQIQPRQLDYGSRSLPVFTFRVRQADSTVVVVTYTGEMDGQVSQGDFLVMKGLFRGPGVFRATEIWLRGRIEAMGTVVPVTPPIRLASKRVCAVATCLYGPHAEETQWLRGYRDRVLARTASGRFLVRSYNALAPAFTVLVLERSSCLRWLVRRGLDRGLELLRKRALPD